uniref:Uncharacterized protein n=1 Tax=Lepeophtheirus salmonis TaxID=72036 RepID=A0A0K2U5Q8_LEPSM
MPNILIGLLSFISTSINLSSPLRERKSLGVVVHFPRPFRKNDFVLEDSDKEDNHISSDILAVTSEDILIAS